MKLPETEFDQGTKMLLLLNDLWLITVWGSFFSAPALENAGQDERKELQLQMPTVTWPEPGSERAALGYCDHPHSSRDTAVPRLQVTRRHPL